MFDPCCGSGGMFVQSEKFLAKHQGKLDDISIYGQESKQKASIDWRIKENVRAKLRVILKRTLRQYGYPPDMQALATETVLKQAELIAD